MAAAASYRRPDRSVAGCCFVIYSFIGIEIVGITPGEAADRSRTMLS
jgi:L-asparagine transporter-like permease